jgi:Fur family ferric uptake transcriptional regulator
MTEHCHFYCDACDTVFDIELDKGAGIPLPKGFEVKHYDVAIHGLCPSCSGRED